MQSVTSNAVAVANSYSENETFTGRYWVNGKKIYRRVFGYTLTANNQSKSFSIPNYEKKITLYGNLRNPSGTDFCIPYHFADITNYYGTYCYINSRTSTLYFYPYSSNSSYFQTGSAVEITVEYTKTTD